LDDVHPFAPLHNASLVLPPLLALAQIREGVTGAAFLKAAVAGFEVGPRAGLALGGIEMLTRGWHSGAVFGTHGAAAASGALLGLDAAGFEDALGLAATQSAGLMSAQFEAMCKRMHHGFSARAGLLAAWLAADGYTGIKRVFEQEYGGFLTMFGEAHTNDASQVSRGLGTVWETERITVKPYAAMGGLLAPVAAICRLRSERPFRPNEIDAIDIWVGNAVFHHGAFPVERPLTSVGAQMSLAYTAAVAAIDGAAMARQYSAERIGSDDVWALVPRIRMHVDERFQGSPKLKLRTRVRIRFTDGTERETEESIRFADEITNADIAAKFRTLCEGVVSPERRDCIAETVLGIEHAADIQTLLKLLGPEVASPL
jgi:aconitate decarboxylase